MSITLPPNWTLFHGLPMRGEGDACVVLYVATGIVETRMLLIVGGKYTDLDSVDGAKPFSPEHFAAGDKLLNDYLAKKREECVKEVFRSEHITVFRGAKGDEAGVYPYIDEGEWFFRKLEHKVSSDHFDTRELAEAAARRALAGGE